MECTDVFYIFDEINGQPLTIHLYLTRLNFDPF